MPKQTLPPRFAPRRLPRMLCCLGALWLPGAGHVVADGGETRIAILYGQAERYQIVAEAIAERLRSTGRTPTTIALPARDADAQRAALEQLRKFRPTIIAAGGTTATAQALGAVPDVPVVFFMVPNALDAPFLSASGAGSPRVTGVAANADPTEQLRWVRDLAPRVRKLAVLSGPRTRRTVAALQSAGTRAGVDVVAIQASTVEFPNAISELDARKCDGVLMIPDADVYNSDTVRRLLLWGVRNKKPVWAFAENVVKAGALAGAQVDLDAVGTTTVGLIERVITGQAPRQLGLRYAQRVERSVNLHTARMIDLPVDRWRDDISVAHFGGP